MLTHGCGNTCNTVLTYTGPTLVHKHRELKTLQLCSRPYTVAKKQIMFMTKHTIIVKGAPMCCSFDILFTLKN